MVIKILANVDHFALEGITDHILSHGVGVSNNQGIKKQFFSDPSFVEAIGSINNASLNRDSYFLCAIINKKNEPVLQGDEITDIKGDLNAFISCLWFAKDNSVNSADIYSHVIDGEQHSFTASSPAERVSNSYGEKEDVYFTQADLEFVQAIAEKYKSLTKKNTNYSSEAEELLGGDSSNPESAIILSSFYTHGIDDNRIERAMRFLRSARATDYLPYKISLYVPVLESLFGCGITSGAAQSISRRVAKYTGADKADRIQIFATIKAACKLRAQYFHGAAIENDVMTMTYYKELSKEIDMITRKVLTRIIMEDAQVFLQDDLTLDTYLNELVLG